MPQTASSLNFTSYSDCIEHALDYLGGTADAQTMRDCIRSIVQAYRDVTNARTWTYLQTQGLILTDPPYAQGTVAYIQNGYTPSYGAPAIPRALVLSGAAWPVPALAGTTVGPGWQVRLGTANYQVDSYVSPTVLTLSADDNPGHDLSYHPQSVQGVTNGQPTLIYAPNHGLATGAQVIIENFNTNGANTTNGTWTITVVDSNDFSLNTSNSSLDSPWDGFSGTWRSVPTQTYILVHDEYLLPSDYIKQNTAIYESNFGGMSYADYNDYLWWQRYQFNASVPKYYTIVGSRNWPGRLSIYLWPYPIESRTIKWIYMRRPRDLHFPGLTTGTVTVTSGLTAVVGNGVAFPANCNGCLLRLGTPSNPPGSWISATPPTFETFIQNWNSATSLTMNDPSPYTGTFSYNMTDPIDVEQTSMLTPVLRGIEKYLQRARNIQGKPDASIDYEMALKTAEAADSRSYQGRAMGQHPARRVPYKYMPWTNQSPATW